MTTIISFIAVLGLLIFIHELGHFGVAKLSGVGVEKFSLGFGPKLIGIKRGETEYRISMLPLCGYVKMIGEAPGEEVAPSAARKSFANKPVLTRASIVAAGPVMNLVLAALLLPVIFMIGIDAPAYLDKPAVVGYVAPEGAAYKAGVKKDDVIKEINDSEIKDWEALLSTLAMNPGKSIGIEVFRGGHEVKLTLTPDTSRDTGGGYAGMYPPMRPVIFEVAEKYPAKEAGLKAGDTILAVNGKEITHWAELEGIIHKDGSKKKFLIDRGGENFTAEITPVLNKDMNVYLIGISRKVDTVFK
ncbi:MAG: RIP metalloprotease RseP, partial [Deltaproteobacteria bacterium]|nr:RIP metalloprotease RseP [Deltaproteobacteria bacterium]